MKFLFAATSGAKLATLRSISIGYYLGAVKQGFRLKQRNILIFK